MRILVCGGRDYADRATLFSKLDEYLKRFGSLTIISGMAPGADTLAVEWARQSGASIHSFYAEWEKYGKSAGPKRNQKMIDVGNPHMVVAFPGGRGTEDMILKAQGACIPVVRVALSSQHHPGAADGA